MFNLDSNLFLDLNNRLHETVVSKGSYDELSKEGKENIDQKMNEIMALAEKNHHAAKKFLEASNKKAEEVLKSAEQDLVSILEATERFRATSQPRQKEERGSSEFMQKAQVHVNSLLDSAGEALQTSVHSLFQKESTQSKAQTFLESISEAVETKANSLLDALEESSDEESLEALDWEEEKSPKSLDSLEKGIEEGVFKVLDAFEKKIDEKLEAKEEELVNELEETLLAASKPEREAISKDIQVRYGQSTWSKIY